MPDSRRGYAFNTTRQSFLATEMRIADTHWSRLRGLMAMKASQFPFGWGLWIIPSHGVHTWAMRFPIDVIYLDSRHVVVHVEENLRPWHIAPIRMDTKTVLEVPCHTIWHSGTRVGDQVEVTISKGEKRDKAVA